MAKAVFGAGCFWGVEKKFSEVKGVTSTEVGYSQGKNSKTSYEEVCTGTTDHVEVVLVEFEDCLLYTSPSPRDATLSRMPSSA